MLNYSNWKRNLPSLSIFNKRKLAGFVVASITWIRSHTQVNHSLKKKEKSCRRNMMFLFAKLTKEIIFVCTIFFVHTKNLTCVLALISALHKLWHSYKICLHYFIFPTNLQLRQKLQKFLGGLRNRQCRINRGDHLAGRQLFFCFYDIKIFGFTA